MDQNTQEEEFHSYTTCILEEFVASKDIAFLAERSITVPFQQIDMTTET